MPERAGGALPRAGDVAWGGVGGRLINLPAGARARVRGGPSPSNSFPSGELGVAELLLTAPEKDRRTRWGFRWVGDLAPLGDARLRGAYKKTEPSPMMEDSPALDF